MLDFGRQESDGAKLSRGAEAEGWLLLRCDFDEELVAALKKQIPRQGRYWSAKLNAWYIATQYGKVVVQLVAEILNEYIVLS